MTLFYCPPKTLESRHNPVHWSPWSQVPSHEQWTPKNKKYDKEVTRDSMTCIRLPYLAFNQPGKLWSLSMSPLPFVFCLKHKLSLWLQIILSSLPRRHHCCSLLCQCTWETKSIRTKENDIFF